MKQFLSQVDTMKSKRNLLETIRHLTKSTVGGKPIPMIKPKIVVPQRLETDQILNRAKAKREAWFEAKRQKMANENPITPAPETEVSLSTSSTQLEGMEISKTHHFELN